MKILICALIIASVTTSVWAGELPVDLTELSLEELMNIEIVSVFKKEGWLFEAPAAVYMITGEEIRRSGFTSIPEVLRMVPGMQVARIDANKWTISPRGSYGVYGSFANKLLVLIDGRNVYQPVFPGVSWEAQDVLLEDVDRIEVIRGPGAALWGANAVNGVLNILNKNAQDTQGGVVRFGGGSEERGFGCLRYGGKLNEDVYYRVYARYFRRDDFVYTSGEEGVDGWGVLRGGFRIDWEISCRNSLTFLGDMYDGEVGHAFSVPGLEPPVERIFDADASIAGGNVLGRWEHTFSNASDVTLQLYYDRIEREEAVIRVRANTVDVDFQHRLGIGARQEVVWGFGYRSMSDKLDNTFTFSFNPDSRNVRLFSAFVQDDVTLVEDRLCLTLGSKFEHNDYTGFEIQPDVRLLWTPHARHTGWGAVSRAVRTPSRAENDSRFVAAVRSPGLLFPEDKALLAVAFGNPELASEELLALELGYRVRPKDRLLLDIATFYHMYDRLRTFEPGAPFLEASPAPEHLVIPYFCDEKMHGESYGVELEADWRMLDWWRLSATHTYLRIYLHLDEDSGDPLSEGAERESPDHQFSLRSSMDLPKELELDLGLRYVDELPNLNVESYVTLDARLEWSPRDNLDVSLVGQNLLDTHHFEFKPVFFLTLPTEVERGMYGAITWRF